MMPQLVSPTLERKDAFLAMFEDFARAGEAWWCKNNADAQTDFAAYVDGLAKQAGGLVDRGWVPTSHYWLVQAGQVIGSLRVRHYLNPVVRENTGHIGYDIAPSHRRKGNGGEILRLGLLEATKLGIGDVLIHCADANIGSRKIILKHGGVATGHKNGETWYWIERRAEHPVIREALPEDAGAIARVHVASWQGAYRGIMPDAVLEHLSVAQWTDDWEARLEPPERLTFVVEVEGVIQGWASIGPCRDEAAGEDSGELYGIYLDPACWSQRLGAGLYLRAETALRASGFTEACAWVLEANARARRFYEKAGYAPDGQTKRIQRETTELMEVRYQKSLRQLG